MRRSPHLLAALLASGAVLAGTPVASHAQPDDWGAGPRDPFDKSVVAKYKGILARNPHDADALAKLLSLYRRYRTLDLLKTEYEAQLKAKAGDGPTLIMLGRIAHAAGDDGAALTYYETAATGRTDDGPLAIELGDLYKRATRLADARTAYDRGLLHSKDKAPKMKALRALADLALGANDIDGAKKYFEQYIGLDKSNVQLRIELGDALATAGKHDDAIVAYAEAERLLGGDPARKIEVMARIGAAREGKGEDDLAIVEYKRAIKAAPKGYWIITELTQRIVDIYRRKQKLTDLIKEFEDTWPASSRGHFEWDTLARLYEETGSADGAIEAYKKAVAKAPWELDTQRRLIQMLETSGRDDEALAQYEAVVKAAPGEARFQIDLADRYWRRGKADKAMAQIKRLESSFGHDAGVQTAIADMYMRWGKDDLALAAFERLVKMEPDEPSHLVTLGDQYYTRGDKAKAKLIWTRLASKGTAAGYAELGQTLADHGETAEALAALVKAVTLEPANAEHYKKRAALYETMRRFSDAVADWQKVIKLLVDKAAAAGKPVDRSQRRDAQRRLVQVAVRDTRQEAQLRTVWIRDFSKNPPDVDAGLMLSTFYAKKNLPTERQAVLLKLRGLVPDDQDVLTDLVKAYRDQRKYDEAVALLLELIKLAKSREREVYSQIAEIKTEARDDAEAIRYSRMALDISAGDPGAHERLAERYAEMQRTDDAIASYEMVVKLDARNTKARFALAQLYEQTSQPLRAADLYRGILRTSTDDEALGRAGREGIDLEEAIDSLGGLEQVVAPLSFVLSHKPIYRRILVDLYLRYVPRLVDRERRGDPTVRAAARAELTRIGAHGLKPLLEALHDEKDPEQQRVAVSVLGYLGNRGAAPALVKLATEDPLPDPAMAAVPVVTTGFGGRGGAGAGGGLAPLAPIGTLRPGLEWALRVEALVAAGRLGEPATFGAVAPLTSHDEVAMREAAVFALGQMHDKRALPYLTTALGDRRESVQVLGCLALADQASGQPDGKSAAAMATMVADPQAHDLARAACAYGLGARKAAGAATTKALTAAVLDNRGEAQRLAAWALGRLGDKAALGSLMTAYFARASADRAELGWAIGRVLGVGADDSALSLTTSYPLRAGKFDATARIGELPGDIAAPAAGLDLGARSDGDGGAMIAAIAAALQQGLGGTDGDVALRVLEDLDRGAVGLSLGGLSTPTPDAREQAALAKVGAAISADVLRWSTSADPRTRAAAISVLTKAAADPTNAALVDALVAAASSSATTVRAAALRSIGTVGLRAGTLPPALATALRTGLTATSWQDRRSAALAYSALATRSDHGGLAAADLVRAASDASSFVREAVASALRLFGNDAAAGQALATLARDPIEPVRVAAGAAKTVP